MKHIFNRSTPEDNKLVFGAESNTVSFVRLQLPETADINYLGTWVCIQVPNIGIHPARSILQAQSMSD